MQKTEPRSFMRIMASMLVVLVLFSNTLLLMMEPAQAANYTTGTYVVSHKNGSNVRANASMSGTLQGSAKKGVTFAVTKISGEWGYTSSIQTTSGTKKGWVSLKYCTYQKSSSKTTLILNEKEISFPASLKKGTGQHIYGIFHSTGSKIASVTVQVLNTSNKTQFIKTVYPKAYSYNLYNSTVDYAMKFGSLSAGTYTLWYTAKTQNGKTLTLKKTFNVVNPSTIALDTKTISFPDTIAKGNSQHIKGKITSTGSKIASATAQVLNASHRVQFTRTVSLHTYSYNLYNSTLDYAMKFGSLSAGTYTLKYTAKTTDGKTLTLSKTFRVINPPKKTISSNTMTDKNNTATVPSTAIYVSQGKGTPYCTAASAAMLVRAELATQNKSYSHVTLKKFMESAWSGGLKNNFTYAGVHVTCGYLSGTASQKKAKVQKILERHPEGVVLYGWTSNDTYQHAVYMANNGKILDPYPTCGAKYLDLSKSANTASRSWSTMKKYWIVK